jgi:hypothetical protein
MIERATRIFCWRDERRIMKNKKLIFSAISMTSIALAALLAGPLGAMPQKSAVELVPHRAIYDLRLGEASSSSNVADLRGRLVFDFSGSRCDGYTYKSRLVTEMTDQDGGAVVTDMRTSTWENFAGDEFRFENVEYNGFHQTSLVSGLASRKEASDKIAVKFEEPSEEAVEFNRRALFPTQHSIAILEAAERGESVLQADVFDGSEEGKKLYTTTTFIGRAHPPTTGKHSLEAVPNADHLKALTSWPISISYYDVATPGSRTDGLPTYELAFRLYSNGVSGDLTINYGDFMIGGKLKRIDFKDAGECPAEKK